MNDIKSFDFGHIYKSAPFGQCPFTFEMLPRPLSPGQTGKHCCARYLSYLYLSYQCFGMCLTSVGKRRNSVSSNVSEFGRKYFCSPGSNFCFCIKSHCYIASVNTKRDWLICSHVALDKCNVSRPGNK